MSRLACIEYTQSLAVARHSRCVQQQERLTQCSQHLAAAREKKRPNRVAFFFSPPSPVTSFPSHFRCPRSRAGRRHFSRRALFGRFRTDFGRLSISSEGISTRESPGRATGSASLPRHIVSDQDSLLIRMPLRKRSPRSDCEGSPAGFLLREGVRSERPAGAKTRGDRTGFLTASVILKVRSAILGQVVVIASERRGDVVHHGWSEGPPAQPVLRVAGPHHGRSGPQKSILEVIAPDRGFPPPERLVASRGPCLAVLSALPRTLPGKDGSVPHLLRMGRAPDLPEVRRYSRPGFLAPAGFPTASAQSTKVETPSVTEGNPQISGPWLGSGPCG